VWTFAHTPAAEPDAEIEAGRGVRNILCAVDLKPSSTGLIEWSAKCAESFGAALTLVHAVAAPEPWEPEADPFRNFLFRTAQEELAKMQSQLGTKFTACVVAGPVAQAIQHAAANHQADLIVIGRGVLHGVFGQLRSQTYEIVRESPCPVISV
jgi:nucleotide-binding universal stress UspA family protein